MQGLILHCGSKQATRLEVESMKPPVYTRSHRPPAYGEILEYTEEQYRHRGYELTEQAYGLNREGQQLFGVMTFAKPGDVDSSRMHGLRTSYNKTLGLCSIGGRKLWVCDNLMLDGDTLKVVRKNTTNVWRDYKSQLQVLVEQIEASEVRIAHAKRRLKEIPCSIEAGYRVIGVAQGRGLVKPNQASVCFKDWKTPRHEEFSERNLWSLYNCFTEGLKKGAVGDVIERHVNTHSYFGELVGRYEKYENRAN